MFLEDLKLTDEELERGEKWKKEHPFTLKWYEKCPPPPLGKNPLYEKPKPAETINQEEINIEEDMSKEIKIERVGDPRDQLIAQNNETVPGVERAKPLTDLDEYEDDSRIFVESKPETIMGKCEEEAIRENVRKNLQKGMLSDKEEEEIKEKFENPEVRSVYDVLAGVLSFLFPYEPGENIDRNRKISESDMINIAANLIPRMREAKKNMFYNRHKLPEDKVEDVEKLAKGLTGCNEEGIKKEYIAPKCEFVKNTPSIRGDFDGICQEMMELHRRKNNDYGNAADASYREFGITSYVIRLNDKMNRLKSLTKRGVGQEVKNESIEDTLMDLAAYAIMAIESLRS